MELLRIALGTTAVRDACIAWARQFVPGDFTGSVEGLPEKMEVTIVFGKKRIRKQKAEK